jgi:hypothetical protein
MRTGVSQPRHLPPLNEIILIKQLVSVHFWMPDMNSEACFRCSGITEHSHWLGQQRQWNLQIRNVSWHSLEVAVARVDVHVCVRMLHTLDMPRVLGIDFITHE